MKKIIVIGGGFGGLSAVNMLCKLGLDFDITLIDKKENADFLPMLPDCIGRGINPQYLSYKIENLAKKLRFKFLMDEADLIDLDKKEILTKTRRFSYDFLVIASGSETNFYGNNNIKDNAFKLDDAGDAKNIVERLRQGEFDNYLICGGGYTGVEVATNLRIFLTKNKKSGRIIIIERAPSILGPLPEWMKNYVSENFKRLNVEVFVNNSIEKIENGKVFVSGGRALNNSMVIWAAGVKTSGFIQNLKVEKNPQGRIKVDDYLRLSDSCFVIGDAAYFSYKNTYLRMAVQFAIAQGECVAASIIKSVKGKRLKKYRPVDFGYIIPMANNKSCGRVFGINLKGLLPTMFHFMMCIYRSYGLKNKFGIIRELITGGEI
jgi:NADH dehydrogenase